MFALLHKFSLCLVCISLALLKNDGHFLGHSVVSVSDTFSSCLWATLECCSLSIFNHNWCLHYTCPHLLILVRFCTKCLDFINSPMFCLYSWKRWKLKLQSSLKIPKAYCWRLSILLVFLVHWRILSWLQNHH